MSTRIKVGIIGAAGYTGGEMIRLLLNHPMIDLIMVQSRSQDGKRVCDVHHDLLGESELTFVANLNQDVDVLFLCLSHGESKKYLEENDLPTTTRIIDLGNDFRLGDKINDRSFVYGLPEFQRNKIRQAKNIANPGCFATAIQLGLLPLVSENLLEDVHTVGITGSTGAGQKLQETSHFSWRANNISAYKTLTHQHMGEINRTLQALGFEKAIHFVPWRGDFTRGIFVSSITSVAKSLNEVINLYKNYYQSHPFVHISSSMIDLKQVVNTNKCLIYLEMENQKLVIHSAIDNLLKGACGQAVQNMNLMLGWEETMGLKLKSIAF